MELIFEAFGLLLQLNFLHLKSYLLCLELGNSMPHIGTENHREKSTQKLTFALKSLDLTPERELLKS